MFWVKILCACSCFIVNIPHLNLNYFWDIFLISYILKFITIINYIDACKSLFAELPIRC